MKIVLIGAGNVGWHLGKRFHECGVEIIQVFSREESKARRLGDLINTESITDLDKVNRNADMYMLAVHDDAIGEVALKLASFGFQEKLIVHTSGATPMTVFPASLNRFGVFYPLQTFSISREPDFGNIPVCVDANSEEDLPLLNKLAFRISPKVYHITDEQRAVIHVAAVFVNNFPNYLFQVGKSILDEKKLPFEILLPLMQETVSKLNTGDPFEMQTGPAVRGDSATIKRHLSFLKKYPDYEELYKLFTESIEKAHRQ